jgi:hypothetical protein
MAGLHHLDCAQAALLARLNVPPWSREGVRRRPEDQRPIGNWPAPISAQGPKCEELTASICIPGLRTFRRRNQHHNLARSASARRPASVIRTRVTSIARSSAICSVVTLASPALISSTNRSLLKPCASRMADRGMRRVIRARGGARRYGAGLLPVSPCGQM